MWRRGFLRLRYNKFGCQLLQLVTQYGEFLPQLLNLMLLAHDNRIESLHGIVQKGYH